MQRETTRIGCIAAFVLAALFAADTAFPAPNDGDGESAPPQLQLAQADEADEYNEEEEEEEEYEEEDEHFDEFNHLREHIEELEHLVDEQCSEQALTLLYGEIPEAKELVDKLEARADTLAGAGEAGLHSRAEHLELLREMCETAGHLLAAKAASDEAYPRILESARVHLQVRELEAAYHGSQDADERERIRAELRDVVAREFDLDQAFRRDQAGEIERELERVRRALEQREANKELIIERRMTMMLEGYDPFE